MIRGVHSCLQKQYDSGHSKEWLSPSAGHGDGQGVVV